MGAAELSRQEKFRRQCAAQMVDILREVEASDGLCTVAISIDGMLDGMADYLVPLLGPSGAYQKLQRICDDVARRVADQQRARGQQ